MVKWGCFYDQKLSWTAMKRYDKTEFGRSPGGAKSHFAPEQMNISLTKKSCKTP